MPSEHKRRLTRARIRNAALFLILLIAATGLLYRMLRPYFATPPAITDSAQPVTPADLAVPVSRVIDGDTIEVRWRENIERVRLLRINTPERGHRGYREATRALEALIADNRVTLEFERHDRVERDRYGRLLAYVLIEGRNANVEMVRQGWTRFWTRYGSGRLIDEFVAAEKQARNTRAGLWSDYGWSLD